MGFLKNRSLIFLLFILSLVFSLRLTAQNYIVNSNIDAVAANLVTGETATPGQITLRSAIQAATAQPGAHIITFSGAVVSPINLSLGQITLGNAANGNNITISGPGMNLLTVNQTTENRIFSTGTGAVTILLQDITLNYTGPAVTPYSGGGGAIIAGGAGAASTFINCRFTNFQRQIGNGGAISQSSSLASHNLTITNCIFTNNRAGGAGGAVSFNSQGGTATITGCTFDNNHTGPVGANTGGDGGAVSVTGGGAGGTYLIEKNTFLNNQVENVTGHAGAIMSTNGTATIRFNRFVGNTCANVAFPPLANIIGQAGGATTHVTIADNNWWGVNTGPGANDATALAAGAVMTLTKWLQLKATASPNPICASSPSNLGHTSTVTASLLSNSANEAIAIGNLPVLIGLPVTWASTLGSLSGQQVTIQAAGTATALFTSNGTGGTATVNASVDNIPLSETTPARANITVNTLSTPPSGATGTTTICYGTTTTLTVSGGFKGTGAVTQWYTGSCGGVLAFTGDVFTTPALTTTTTYYVRYSGDCNTTTCATVVVTVLPQVNYGNVVNGSVSHLVISQVYGGGGNAGAPYLNDFIELFNPTGSTISLTGWSVQYASAAGTSWTNKTDLTGSIAPGKYYLIKQASGGAVGVALPTEDLAGTISMSATAGKVALVNSTVVLSGSGCPFGASIIDFVGYGTTADCFEGVGKAPAPSNTTADLRGANGCTDTDNNSLDFTAGAPNPRNSSSAANLCASTLTVCSGTIPGSMSVSGASGGSGTFTYQWYSKNGVVCPTGTDITGWTALGGGDGTGFNTATFTPTVGVTADKTFACLVTAAGSPTCPPPTWASGCRVVVVNNLTGGTVAESQVLCTPADPAEFTESIASTGDGTLGYQWESSTVSDFSSAVTVIPGATGPTYDAPAGLTVTTYYRRVTTSTLNGVACTTNSNILTVTVNPDNTITLSSAPGTNAQTVCINTPIINITYSTTGATGANFSGLPAGVSGAWAANVVTISGSPTTAAGSPFNYTVNLTGGCGTISANGTITVTPDNTITLTSAPGTNAQNVCINTPVTNITYSTTGATGANFSGLPAGVSGAWAANVVTISGTPTTSAGSPFNYTVTLTGGCGNITANGSITVRPDNTITLSSAPGTNAQTVCINTPIINITYATTGATGANFSGLPAGVSGAWAANVVTISGSPTTTVGSPFNYTVNLTGGCGTVSANGSISVTGNNTITLTSAPGTDAQLVVVNNPITNITYATTGATGATFSGLPAGVSGAWAANVVTISGSPTTIVGSPFNYTVTLTGGCGNITATGSITVIACSITLTSAAGTNAQTVCINNPITNITYATAGATGANFSGLPTGVSGAWLANVATISGTPSVAGAFNYTVTLTGGGCGVFTANGSITVNPTPTVDQPANQVVCTGTSTSAINFSGAVPGTIFNWTNNTPSIGLAASGTGNIASFLASNATNAPVVATITVTPSTGTGSVNETFNYTGGVQTLTVPPGVTSINIQSWGAQGGANWVNNVNYGGFASGDLSVTPGEVLYIYVGGQPTTTAGGFNGGGNGEGAGIGGGGASDVRQGGTNLTDRKIVAAGAGGAGYWSNLHVVGGIGGGLTGGNGYRDPSYAANPGGQGATQTSSGTGTCINFNVPAMAGGFGYGGSPVGCGCEGYGGGGGWYGGAGSGNCRGGGGGSSYIGSVTNGSTTGGVNVGHGKVIITTLSSEPFCEGSSKTFTITVNPLPTITCPGNQSVNNTPGLCSAVVNYGSSSTGTPAPAITYVFTGATTGSGSGNGSGSAFNVGITNVTLTATNSCGVATCSFTVTVIDNQPPVITICAADKTSSTDAGSCTKTFTAVQIGVPTAFDNCSYTLSWIRSDGAPNLTDPFNFGITTITWTATDPVLLTASCVQTININQVSTITTVTVTPNTQQYSDKVTFVATVTPNNCPGAGPIGGTVTFKIGTLVMGTAPVLADGTATLADVALLEPTLDPGNPPNGPLKPGVKTVTAVYSGTDADYAVSDATTALTITCEDARAYYTGACYTSTASQNSSNATVTLSATIKDISSTPDAAGDVSSGDIRNATVTFINRDNNTVIATVPVGLVNPGDLTVGTATYNWNVTISGDAQNFTIGIIVNNYYCRNSSNDNTVVTVAKPLGDLFISGGGYLVLTNSAGIKAGTAGTKNNFGFNVKYNKAKTNLQGNINTIVRKMEAGIMRVYQIKGNVMTSLVVSTSCPKTAIFNGKANIKDITDPLAPISIDGNATLQVKMTDMGEPGSSDKIAITVWNKDGGLWFASNWDGTRTVEQTLGGGNLKVHGGGSCEQLITGPEEEMPTPTPVPTETIKPIIEPVAFKVNVYPNPSASDFSIQVFSQSSEPIVVRILDINGVVKGVSQVYTKNSLLKMGAGLPGGTYFAEVTQGTNKQMIKLIKLN